MSSLDADHVVSLAGRSEASLFIAVIKPGPPPLGMPTSSPGLPLTP